MVELYGRPFVELIDRMRLEFARQEAIFDLPARRWWLPTARRGPDLSVRFHDRVAGTPVGPASGPQSQMAQNIVLSWLAGSRIMELKTVQVNDALTIGRPCIDAANLGYNIEWSQELAVADSLDQYVQGAMLVHMLRTAPEVFGRPFGEVDFSGNGGRDDLRHVDRLRPGGHPIGQGPPLHRGDDRRDAERGAAATRDSAAAGRACATSTIRRSSATA